MTLPVLSSASLYAPYALISNMEMAPSPTHIIKYDITYNQFLELADADIYYIDTPFTEIFPNDPFGSQEDFNFLDNKLWSIRKLLAPHSLTPESVASKITLDGVIQDITLGNRSFGFPILIHNKSETEKTFNMSIHHSIAAKISFDSMFDELTNTAIFNVEKISPALDRSTTKEPEDIWLGNEGYIKKDYEMFNEDDRFSVGKLSEVDNRIILIGENKEKYDNLSIPDNASFSKDIIPFYNLNYMYGKIIDYNETDKSYVIEFWNKDYTNKINITDPAKLSEYTVFTPYNQLIKIMNLGSGEFVYDSSSNVVIKANAPGLTYRTTADSKGIYDWTYFYPTSNGVESNGSISNNVFANYAFNEISINLEPNQFRIIHISVIKIDISNSFSNGVCIGLEEV